MQNTSHAVMAQRHEPNDSLDFFPTPPWATRALCEFLSSRQYLLGATCWEPACGQGHMARPLGEYFGKVVSSDIEDYGYGKVADFFTIIGIESTPDWIITNPPFNLGKKFALRSLYLAKKGAAMLVRTSFLEGGNRYVNLFKSYPPTDILQFTERVPMHKGILLEKASTATAYCWLIWFKDYPPETHFHWTGIVRKKLEKPGDYE